MQFRIALAAMAWMAVEVEDDYRRDFTGALMRVDYFHTGTASRERFSLDRIQGEGPWAGNPRRLLDSTGLGKYRFQLVVPDSGRILFSRGFSSIYGEWETTEEARQEIWRTFPEAVCFPEPRRTVRLELYKRDRRQAFQPVWDVLIDPSSNEVDRSPTTSPDETTLMRNGPSSDKVDLLFLETGIRKKKSSGGTAGASPKPSSGSNPSPPAGPTSTSGVSLRPRWPRACPGPAPALSGIRPWAPVTMRLG